MPRRGRSSAGVDRHDPRRRRARRERRGRRQGQVQHTGERRRRRGQGVLLPGAGRRRRERGEGRGVRPGVSGGEKRHAGVPEQGEEGAPRADGPLGGRPARPQGHLLPTHLQGGVHRPQRSRRGLGDRQGQGQGVHAQGDARGGRHVGDEWLLRRERQELQPPERDGSPPRAGLRGVCRRGDTAGQ